MSKSIKSSIESVSGGSKDLEKRLKDLASEYQELCDTLRKKLKEEQAYDDSYESLDAFTLLNNVVSRNLRSVKNAQHVIRGLRDLSGFNVSEIEEEVVTGNIRKLLK